jgi:hypothetical protein
VPQHLRHPAGILTGCHGMRRERTRRRQ